MLSAALLRCGSRRLAGRATPVRHGPLREGGQPRWCSSKTWVSAADIDGTSAAFQKPVNFSQQSFVRSGSLGRIEHTFPVETERLDEILAETDGAPWESVQQLFLERSKDKRSTLLVSAVADTILDRNIHLNYSVKNLFDSVRAFHVHQRLSGHHLLQYCLSKLEAELPLLPVADIPLLLNTVATLGLLKRGRLLEVMIEAFQKSLPSASPKLIAVFVEQLSRSRCLSADFGDAVVEHVLHNKHGFGAKSLTTVVLSLSYAHVASCSKLLDLLDETLAKRDKLEVLSERDWCGLARTFANYRYPAPLSQDLFAELLYSGGRLSVDTFVTFAAFLCFQCQVKDAVFLNTVQRAIQQLWNRFTSEQLTVLSSVVVDLSKLEKGKELAKNFAGIFTVQLPNIRSRDIIKAFNSFQKADILTPSDSRLFMKAILPALPDLSMKDMVHLLQSVGFVCGKSPSVEGEKLVNAIFSHLAEAVICLPPELVSRVAITLNVLGLRHPALLSELSRYGLKLLLESSDNAQVDLLSTIALTLSRLNFAAANLFVELHRRLEAGAIACTTEQCVSLTWACVTQGMIPHGALRSSVFTLEAAPSGEESLRHLQMLRDLHVLAEEEVGITGFPDKDIVQKLYHVLGVKQMHFAIPMEASDMLRSILGEDSIWCGCLTTHSFLLPAAALFDMKTGMSVPWKTVGADPEKPLPCPKMLAEKHNVYALAILTPSLVLPELAPSGSTVLMLRLLRACGWKVAMLPQERWRRLDSFGDKVKYLKQLLLHVLTEEKADGD